MGRSPIFIASFSTVAVAGIAGAVGITTNDASADAGAFQAAQAAAMTKMMQGMGVATSGDVDRDFAVAMIAHHQGAVDMARAELRYKTNPHLLRLAQGIVVEQAQEIGVMAQSIRDDGSRIRGRTPGAPRSPESHSHD